MEGLVNYSSEDEQDESGYRLAAERGSYLKRTSATKASNTADGRRRQLDNSGGSGTNAPPYASGNKSCSGGGSHNYKDEESYRYKSPKSSSYNSSRTSTQYHNDTRDREGRETRYSRENRDTRDKGSPRDNRDNKGNRDYRDSPRDNREYRDTNNGNRSDDRNDRFNRSREHNRDHRRDHDNYRDTKRPRDDDRNNQRYSSSSVSSPYNKDRYQNSRLNDRPNNQRTYEQRSRDDRSDNRYERHSRKQKRSESRSPSPGASHKRYSSSRNDSERSRRRNSGSRSRSRSSTPRSHKRSPSPNMPRERAPKPLDQVRSTALDLERKLSAGDAIRQECESRPLLRNTEAVLSLPLNDTPKPPTVIAVAPTTSSEPSVIQLPSYYNPSVINPNKYAEQVQKRKLIWGAKKAEDTSSKWGHAQFSQDSDGKVASKFMRLMGIKGGSATKNEAEAPKTDEIEADKRLNISGTDVKSREQMFSSMEQQYEVARQVTHTMRGVGLGFSSQPRPY